MVQDTDVQLRITHARADGVSSVAFKMVGSEETATDLLYETLPPGTEIRGAT